jgi:thiol-disulfide isomerase/thioredoxin
LSSRFGLSIITLCVFLTSAGFSGSIYENNLKNYLKNDLKKFIFKKNKYKLDPLIVVDDKDNILEINTQRKLLIINFWATWCAPCKKEMPSLNNLAKKFNNDDFRVITIASGRNSLVNIEKFFLENKLDYLQKYRDPLGKTARSYNVLGLPTTVIVTSAGEEVGRLMGDIDWDNKDVYDFIHLLKAEVAK